MSKHYLAEGKRGFPRLSAYENPQIPADNPQESADALALLKDHWCRSLHWVCFYQVRRERLMTRIV